MKTYTEAQFKKLSKSKQRTLLAQDVLDQIAAKKFFSKHGTYLEYTDKKKKYNFFNYGMDYGDSPSAKDFIKDEGTKCYVCAKGSLACSYVGKFNKYSMSKLQNQAADLKEVVEIFGRVLWDAIECWYEGDDVFYKGYDNDDDIYINSREHSLSSIMKNIVANNGKFKLPNGILVG